MLTRRGAVIGAMHAAALAGAGAVMRPGGGHAKAAQPATPINFDVPDNACDCHTHIHGDPVQFPWSPHRVYTPELALPEEMAALHRALHIKRVVVVTPSVYGADNSATLYGMKARGNDARGVAVIDDKTSDAELDALHKAGCRGIRVNLATGGVNDPAVARKLFQAGVDRMAKIGWHVQVYTTLPIVIGIKDLVAASPVPVVFDHFAGAQAPLGVDQPGFGDVLALLRSGKIYVKISGAYRASKNAPDYPDAAPLARALIEANPERIVWGTDWPHPNSSSGRPATELTPLWQIDDGALLNQLPVWAPDAAIRRKILVDNPARLYEF